MKFRRQNYAPNTLSHQRLPVKLPRSLPVVLSPQEVSRLIAAANNVKHQAALSLAYGTGLRASEVVHLKAGDFLVWLAGNHLAALPVMRATSGSAGRVTSTSGRSYWMSRPSLMTATRSPSRNASSMSCVTTTIVVPNFRWMSRRSS